MRFFPLANRSVIVSTEQEGVSLWTCSPFSVENDRSAVAGSVARIDRSTRMHGYMFSSHASKASNTVAGMSPLHHLHAAISATTWYTLTPAKSQVCAKRTDQCHCMCLPYPFHLPVCHIISSAILFSSTLLVLCSKFSFLVFSTSF